MRPAAARSGFARRSSKEKEKGGGWHLLVSEIPYGVQKGKLIEQIAELIAEKKLPILADVKDESDDEDPADPRAARPHGRRRAACWKACIRLTDLEVRFPLNLNVLDENRTPLVMSLKEALSAWLKFQIEVLVRKSRRSGSARSTTGSSCSTAS